MGNSGPVLAAAAQCLGFKWVVESERDKGWWMNGVGGYLYPCPVTWAAALAGLV